MPFALTPRCMYPFHDCNFKCWECTPVARIFALPLNGESFLFHFQSVCISIGYDALRGCILWWR